MSYFLFNEGVLLYPCNTDLINIKLKQTIGVHHKYPESVGKVYPECHLGPDLH